MVSHVDIQKSVWSGTIPLVIHLSQDGLADFIFPKPLHLTVPRVILWSSVLTVIHSYFIKQSTNFQSAGFLPYDNKFLLSSNPVLEACTNELELAEIQSPVWLEGPGNTIIDWQTPVGVCADIWSSTSNNNHYLQHPATLPFKIIAHFSVFPKQHVQLCNIVVCRGWSQSHKENTSKDISSVQKAAANATKHALIEHNLRHLLPIFLQVPSSTHIHTCLSHLRQNASILHDTPIHMMGLQTSLQSLFVCCLFSNNTSELSTMLPSCDCNDCTLFLQTVTALRGALQPGTNYQQLSSSISSLHPIHHLSQAKDMVKEGVHKVINVLKRDDEDGPENTSNRDSGRHYSISSNSPPSDAPIYELGYTPSAAMSKEQKKSHDILFRPATMLHCQITRLIILTRVLCGTLNNFEKSLQKLEIDAKDAWRRRIERQQADDLREQQQQQSQLPPQIQPQQDDTHHQQPVIRVNDQQPTATSALFPKVPPGLISTQAATNLIVTSANDAEKHSQLLDPGATDEEKELIQRTISNAQIKNNNTTTSNENNIDDTTTEVIDIVDSTGKVCKKIIELPPGWKSHYHSMPIRLYITQSLAALSNTQPEYISSSDQAETNNNSLQKYEINWQRYRQPGKFSPLYEKHAKVLSNAANSNNGYEINNKKPRTGQHASLTVEEFIRVIMPEWHYNYGKPEVSSPRVAGSIPSTISTTSTTSINETTETKPSNTATTAVLPTDSLEGFLNSDTTPVPDNTSVSSNATTTAATTTTTTPTSSSKPQKHSGLSNLQLTEQEKEVVLICHGIILPYDTPLSWLYEHMQFPDLCLHIVVALKNDVVDHE